MKNPLLIQGQFEHGIWEQLYKISIMFPLKG